MNRYSILGALALSAVLCSCNKEKKFESKTGESNGYSYVYVTNDPLNTRIYTLKNGLTVYLSKYDAEPRIQTNIAVKAGGKFDPAKATGLAHYLEHIMFKGTADFGTLDWEKEKVYMDSIENMFEHYRTLTDTAERSAYYHKIDQVSNEASRLAIANEYDKMVAAIGVRGSNAYTTDDRTVYIGDIPANQVENWAIIESNRFRTIIPRLFHTELESVYEEKNGSLDDDYNKTDEALRTALFTKHPYGTQTVIGTIEHLKNPSITEIKRYFNTYYRPNNMAICMSSDLDFDKTIRILDTYFAEWQPNEDLKKWIPLKEDPITAPKEVEVYGPDAEWVEIGYRVDGRNSEEHDMLRLTNMILSSQAGLIDLNLTQQQKVIGASSNVEELNDYTIQHLTGKPREGQSLDDVKKLLLDQVDLLKKGEFDEWLIDASINELKKNRLRGAEQNGARTNYEVVAFTNEMTWEDFLSELDGLSRYKKADIVRFANEHFQDNYVVVKKLHGKDRNEMKVVKPKITGNTLNQEAKSPFHEKMLARPVDKIQPVFVDYDKDIKKQRMSKGGIEVLSTRNKENDLFRLYYLSDAGTNNDPRIDIAIEYLDYLGTAEMTASEFKKELYKLGCDFSVSASPEQTYISLTGLTENMDKSIQLFEKLLANPKADDEALKKMIDGEFKKRDDTKKDKYAILFGGLMNYGLYGAKSPFTNVLSNSKLRHVTAAELVDIIKGFTKTEHRILYYGPMSEAELLSSLNRYHVVPDKLAPLPAAVKFDIAAPAEAKVYWANYDMVQAEIMFLSRGDAFDAARVPAIRMFNEYYGGSMASPIFQQMREANGLAYSAFANFRTADKPDSHDSFFGYVGTQADKQAEAMKTLSGLIQNFSASENGFQMAKTSLLGKIESERITKTNILFNYENARRLGLDHDIRKDVYEQAKTMTLEDIGKFQQANIKGRKFNVALVGSREKLNLKDLAKYGKVEELTLDQIFGYEEQLSIIKY